MHFKFTVTYTDAVAGTVVLAPYGSGLTGSLVYYGLPVKLVEKFKIGELVEAGILEKPRYPLDAVTSSAYKAA